jgi:hypothetical protein
MGRNEESVDGGPGRNEAGVSPSGKDEMSGEMMYSGG